MAQVNIFLDSLKSKHTKEAYQDHWDRYLKSKPTGSKKPEVIEDSIVAYLTQMKNEGLSYSYRNSALASIKHHYKMTERRLKLNWEYIAPFLGEKKSDNNIRAYTHGEIAKMLNIADVKYNAAILTLSSTFMRREALGQITEDDMEYLKEHKLFKIIIYRNTKYQQICYTTPEAATAIKLHLQQKKDNHKEIFYFKTPKHLTSTLRKIQIRSGVGQIHSGKNFGQIRNLIPAVNGLRKFGITQMANSGVETEKAKVLSGHSIGVRGHYVKYSEEELLQEYLKAVNNLTINEENRLKDQVEVLEQKNKEIESLKEQVKQLANRAAEWDGFMAALNDKPGSEAYKKEIATRVLAKGKDKAE